MFVFYTESFLPMTIREWPEDDRPREKLLNKGAATLSDAELLAVFLRVGMKGKSAVDLARDLLRHFSSLQGIFHASRSQLCGIPGIGMAKYAQLQAIIEMARRALAEEISENDALSSPVVFTVRVSFSWMTRRGHPTTP